MKKKKKKIETSKLLLLISDLMAAVVLVSAIVAVFVLRDASPLMYLIPAVFGLAGTSHGFYYWKAKAENLNKWGQTDKITQGEEDTSSWNGSSTTGI